ncbi:MAG: threonine synthase [Acidimicrobiia bacterium]|nr:threonine synthase [Acidimicrobiia bacterium]
MSVSYVSTRGAAEPLDFAEVLLAGLARDGGLYVPDQVPPLVDSWETVAAQGYVAAAVEVMWPFVAGSFERDEFAALVADAYATFRHPDVVPVRELEPGLYLAELFWGPTLAFKDVALQLVGRLFDRELARRGERVTVVGATSGDTGSAAIEALRDRAAVDVFILHPHGRVSDVQRRQMTTVDAANVCNVAIDGTFDDCQDLVKALFADEPFRDEVGLSAVNSINFARVLAQIVYYVTAAAAVRARSGRAVPVGYAVPTGNFGNIYAGHLARRMGLPVHTLVVASNRNDILTRFWSGGTLRAETVVPTLSPSMDIQVSSNLERLLWELLGRDGEAVTDLLGRFRHEGTASLDAERFAALREGYAAFRCDDEATLAVMAQAHERYGVLLDPHSAVGLDAALRHGFSPERPLVVLATAHPAKFPDAVRQATGADAALPEHLADLHDRPERVTRLPADLEAVQRLVRARSRATTPGSDAGAAPSPPGCD